MWKLKSQNATENRQFSSAQVWNMSDENEWKEKWLRTAGEGNRCNNSLRPIKTWPICFAPQGKQGFL